MQHTIVMLSCNQCLMSATLLLTLLLLLAIHGQVFFSIVMHVRYKLSAVIYIVFTVNIFRKICDYANSFCDQDKTSGIVGILFLVDNLYAKKKKKILSHIHP